MVGTANCCARPRGSLSSLSRRSKLHSLKALQPIISIKSLEKDFNHEQRKRSSTGWIQFSCQAISLARPARLARRDPGRFDDYHAVCARVSPRWFGEVLDVRHDGAGGLLSAAGNLVAGGESGDLEGARLRFSGTRRSVCDDNGARGTSDARTGHHLHHAPDGNVRVRGRSGVVSKTTSARANQRGLASGRRRIRILRSASQRRHEWRIPAHFALALGTHGGKTNARRENHKLCRPKAKYALESCAREPRVARLSRLSRRRSFR